MGLTITGTGNLQCINCRDHYFDLEDVKGKKVRSSKRGCFRVNVMCPSCEAEMSLVYFDNSHKFSWAVAFAHTVNDEPCYVESCGRCAGNKHDGIWWID